MPTPPIEVSRSAPLRDQVYAAIESMIVNHILAPGERLVEADLATRLNVSRNPVREALTGLSRAGWVIFVPYAGAFVAEQTLEDAEECFLTRRVLESEAAREAAVKVAAGDPEALRASHALSAVMRSASPASEPSDGLTLIQANACFHAELASICGNRLLVDFCRTLEKRLTWFYGAVGFDRTSKSWQEHTALLDAVVAGDPEGAAGLMARHIEKTSVAFRERWSSTEAESAADL